MKTLHLLVITLFFVISMPASAFYTENGKIYNNQQQQIAIYGVNWFGFETTNYVVHGLWSRNWKDMITQMKSLGFTAVRVPFCPTTLQGVSTNSIDYSKNADLQGLNSLEIFDKVLAEFDKQGIYFLLDHHRPDCQAISNLWYIDGYSEQDWINDLKFVATRYQSNSHFLGIDLKNEPHGNATWGTDDAATDWRLASQRAATEVMAANNDILIFVEGVADNPVCSGATAHWWGGNFEPMKCYPLDIPKNRLVLSPHVYGPDVYGQSYFNDGNFPNNMPEIWDTHFGYLVDEGYTVIFGEFGGKYGHGGDAKDVIWQDALVDYMLDKGIQDFFYWSWNPNSGDTGGILQDDWQNVWQDKVDLLKRLMTGSNPDTSTGNDSDSTTDIPTDNSSDTTPDTPTDNGSDSANNQPADNGSDNTPPTSSNSYQTLAQVGQCQLDYVIDSQWQDGMVLRFLLKNTGQAEIQGWQVQWTFPQSTTQVTNLWNGDYTLNQSQISIKNLDWNRTIAPQAQIEFGMQLQGTGLQAPTSATLIGCQGEATNTNTDDSYQAGYAAGIAYCQQNPQACGLTAPTCQMPELKPESYGFGLSIPQLSIVTTEGIVNWQAQLAYLPVEQCESYPEASLFMLLDAQPLQ